MATDPKAILAAVQVPAIPATLREILVATNDPTTTSAKLERLVLRDAGLAIKLLKQVNSSFFGVALKVTSVSQAVVLLGFPTVRSIAAGMVMLETFSRMEKMDTQYLTSVWSQSLVAAGLIPTIGEKLTPRRRDELYLAAMTGNAGHLILNRHFEVPYRELRKLGDLPDPEFEKEKFGVTHAELSAEMLKIWGFAPAVADLVQTHHEIEFKGVDPVELAYLRLADRLAEALRGNPGFLDRHESDIPVSVAAALSDCAWTWPRLLQHRAKIASIQELGQYVDGPRP